MMAVMQDLPHALEFRSVERSFYENSQQSLGCTLCSDSSGTVIEYILHSSEMLGRGKCCPSCTNTMVEQLYPTNEANLRDALKGGWDRRDLDYDFESMWDGNPFKGVSRSNQWFTYGWARLILHPLTPAWYVFGRSEACKWCGENKPLLLAEYARKGIQTTGGCCNICMGTLLSWVFQGTLDAASRTER